MDRELIQSLAKDFESYAIEIDGVECWLARDLQTPLGYDRWENFYTEITNYNVQQQNLQGEPKITNEHVKNNAAIRKTLIERGIKPENLPPEEDSKKLERRLDSENKKSLKQVKKLKRLKKKS
jgi:hypothetical protein